MEVSTEEKSWLSAHLHYSGSLDLLLLQAVKPFIDGLLADQLINQFFFIRYWDRGPHVRLRIKGSSEKLEREVKPALQSYFQHYFDKHPSSAEPPSWVKNLPENQQWFPDHSVQFVKYEPELERYGGPLGILVAEQQFQASSRAILAILAENDTWDYSRALGKAIQLHIAFAHAMDMDLAEAFDFFTYSSGRWSIKALPLFGTTISEEDVLDRKHEAFKAFEQSFNQQKTGLLSLMESLWEACECGEQVEQQWFNTWLKEMKAIKHHLNSIPRIDVLTDAVVEQSFYRNQAIWNIMDSYIHMSNNRLGIRNHDEGYLAYILKEGFKASSLSCK